MSKKAAKKATKPQPNAKGKGATKRAAKKAGKNSPASASETVEAPAPSATPTAPPKGAKRRVTVSVSSGAHAQPGQTASGETKSDAASKGETLTKSGAAKSDDARANKRPRRIIAVPSVVTAKNAVTKDAAASETTSDSFANSPFAGDINDAADELTVESERRAAKGKATVKSSARAKSKPSRGDGARQSKAIASQADGDDAATSKKVTAKKVSASQSAPAKKGKADQSPKSEGGAETINKKAKESVKSSKNGESSVPRTTEPVRKVSKAKATKLDETAQAELALDEPPAVGSSDAAAEEVGSAKARSKRRGVNAEPVPAAPLEQAAEDGELLTLVPGEGIVSDEEDEEDETELEVGADAGAEEEAEELTEEEENRRYLKGIIEALLFASDKPLTGRELARAARIDKKRTLQLLAELRKEYRHRGVNIAEVSGGYVLRSNPAYGAFVQKALAMRPVKLSRAQLETLAIIAYRQPITRPEIDDIRGVDSGQVLKGLADRDLIKMLGKKDEAGRPMLYGTTQTFLELFSLDSLKGLPNLREFTELSEDSREKFAEVTGETIPGPSVASDETGSAGEGTGVSEDGASSTGSSPNEGELDTDLTEGVVPGSNIDDGSVQGADSEAASDGEAPSEGAFLAEDDSVEQGDYNETEDESDDEKEDESDDETEDESDDEVTSGEEAEDDLTADLGASAPEWDDPPEPDFPDDDSR